MSVLRASRKETDWMTRVTSLLPKHQSFADNVPLGSLRIIIGLMKNSTEEMRGG